MKYRGYLLESQHLPGSDFRITGDGAIVARKPKNVDLDYVRVTTPWGFRFNEPTTALAKQAIDRMEQLS